jgi:hypothetical protein
MGKGALKKFNLGLFRKLFIFFSVADPDQIGFRIRILT